MNEGIDFSIIIWGVFVVAGVIIKIFSAAKAKATAQNPKTFDPSDQDGQPRTKSFEDILDDLLSGRGGVQKRAVEETTPEEVHYSRKVDAKEPVKKSSFNGDLSTSETDRNDEDLTTKNEVDFDLRQAVIMSEILRRKYDE